MPSYRFCRPDDIPFLVRAINECYRPYFPDEPEMTVERYRQEMKELSVWPSNCMVAVADGDPIALVIGTKRENEVLVMRVAARPGHQRQGHCRHILTSLSQKLAVLGPERLVVEFPASPELEAFFTACSYRLEETFEDWIREPGPAEPVPPGLVIPASVQDLLDNEALDAPGAGVAWVRNQESLLLGQECIEGVAIASTERIEAYLLYRKDGAGLDLLSAGVADAGRRDLLLGLLLRELATNEGRLRVPRSLPGEWPEDLLRAQGFRPSTRSHRFSAVATPA